MKSQRDLKIVFAQISGKVKATRFEVVGGCSTNLVEILKLGRRASSSFGAAWQAPLKLTLAPPSVTTHYIRAESRARSKQRDLRAAIIRPPPSLPPSPT